MTASTQKFTFMRGKQLLCHRPVALMKNGCNHPPWWMFWEYRFCAADLPLRGEREAYETSGMCEVAKAAVALLPSYKEQEVRDRRMYPDATPCGCEHSP